MGKLSSLTEIHIGRNLLTGCIPVELGRFSPGASTHSTPDNSRQRGVTLPVCTPSLPTFLGVRVRARSLGLDAPIGTWTLPHATGGNGDLVYTLTPDPPAGLSFDAARRALTGTPTALQGATTYTYKVTDSDTDTTATDADSLQFTIAVLPPPDFGTATVANQSYALNTAIADLVLPEATEGAGRLTYTLAPDPPPGLTFTAGTRTAGGYAYGRPGAEGLHVQGDQRRSPRGLPAVHDRSDVRLRGLEGGGGFARDQRRAGARLRAAAGGGADAGGHGHGDQLGCRHPYGTLVRRLLGARPAC